MTVPATALARRRIRDLLRRRLGRRLDAPFPEVPGNSIVPLVEGTEFFARMLACIEGAQVSVDVEMYLWDDDEVGRAFVAALARAAQRRVRVRVLADAYGAREVVGLLDEVSAAGGDVRLFNPFRFTLWRKFVQRTHKKILVLDGVVAFTGGAGFSLSFSGGGHPEQPWRDRMFEMRGPVVTQFATMFETDFGRWRPRTPRPPETDVTLPLVPPPRAAGRAKLRVLRGWPDARDFPPFVLEAIRAAKERIWIGTPYFLPPHRVRAALYQAAARGVDVRVVHPALEHAHPLLYYAVRARYGRWLSRKVRLAEFTAAFYHAKTLVVDRSLVVVGTSNFDSWSWIRNAEIDLAATDAETVDTVASLLEGDLEASRELTREDARVRDLLVSIKQTTASWFEQWL